MSTGVLLENGSNELEILEFKVGDNFYGINVAKIKEILHYQKPTPVPNAHPSVEGIFMPREVVISVINLANSLSLPQSKNIDSDMLIVTYFNKLNIAFHVHGVVGIHRISWSDIIKPDDTVTLAGRGIATGILKMQDKLVIILDLEKIISDINPETSLKVSDIKNLNNRKRNDAPILIAEDSMLLSNLLVECLLKAGYSNIIQTSNGQEAWDKLQEFKSKKLVDKSVKCVITDIEMPQMDGHHLTNLIKNDLALKNLPVVIFSSIINDEMKRKGMLLGADVQITKPEIATLVDALDKLIF